MAIEMTPEEIEAVFREYNDAVIRGVPIEEDLAQRMRDASVGLRGYTRELNQSLSQLKTSTTGLAVAMKNGETGAAVYNKTIESGADAIAAFLKPLGPLGRIIGTIVSLGGKLASEINLQTDALFKSYQDLNRFGAGITTGVEGVLNLSQQMGYTVQTLGSFSSMLERSSSQLALMGGTVSQGTEQLAQMINSVSDQRERWRRLGLDVDAQNEAYSGLMRVLAMTGRGQRMTGDQLSTESQVYLERIVTLSKLTGQTVEEMQSSLEQAYAEQRFASVQRELLRKAENARLDGDDAAAARFENQIRQNEQLFSSVPAEFRAGVTGLMTGFVGTSEEALKFYRGFPAAARMIMSQNFDFAEVMTAAEKDSARTLDQFGRTLGGTGNFDAFAGNLSAMVAMQSAAKRAAFVDRVAQAEAEKAAQTALTGATADQAKLREQQLLATQNIQGLIGVLRGPVTKGMRTLATATGEASTALTRIANINQQGAAPGPGYTAPASTSVTAAARSESTTTSSASAPAANLGTGSSPVTATTAAATTSSTAPEPQPTAETRTRQRPTAGIVIANQPFVPGRQLTDQQMAAVHFDLQSGRVINPRVLTQYNRQQSTWLSQTLARQSAAVSGLGTAAVTGTVDPVQLPVDSAVGENIQTLDDNIQGVESTLTDQINQTSQQIDQKLDQIELKALQTYEQFESARVEDTDNVDRRLQDLQQQMTDQVQTATDSAAQQATQQVQDLQQQVETVSADTVVDEQLVAQNLAQTVEIQQATARRTIANEPFVPGRPLSQTQMSYIDLGLATGKAYPKDVLDQYNRQLLLALPVENLTAPSQVPNINAGTASAVLRNQQSNTAPVSTPQFAEGGIATGPKSGYQATLHGIEAEAVVPLSGGRSIPVDMPDFSASVHGQMQMLTAQMTKLEELVSETRTNNALTHRLLKIAQA